MKKDFAFLKKLFCSTFSVSAFTFGGGYVIVPLLRKKFVEQYQWIEEQEMLDMIAIAQSSPGAIAVNAAVLIGYRLAGFLGAIITVVATVLPPLVIISIVSLFYEWFRDNVWISAMMRGMQAGIAAVIVDVVLTLASGIIKQRNAITIVMMFLAFIAAFVFHINIIYIILICGMVGLVSVLLQKRRGGE